MKVAKSTNDFEFMYDALMDASTCALAISKIEDHFILITCEGANLNGALNN